jgi:phospholipid-translocating ATPase
MQEVNKFLTEASCNGLRTLCMAMRVIEESELQSFMNECKAIEDALTGKDDKLDALFSEFEQGLCLLGATAVEDMLQ